MTINSLRKTFKRICGPAVSRCCAVMLVILIIIGDVAVIHAGQVREDTLEPLFIRAMLDFDDGKYREVTQTLNSLISFLDGDAGKKNKELLSNVYLLLGATCEKTGRIHDARKYYLDAKKIIKKPGIKGLDLSYLVEFQRIVLERKEPVSGGDVIEKPRLKKKKRRSILPWIIGGTVAAAVAVVFLLKKKDEDANDNADTFPNFDTINLGIHWIVVDGTFMMGDTFNEGEEDERPVHEVTLNPFQISQTEITLAQYRQFCNETGHEIPTGNIYGDNVPVVNVDWGDANNFCQWLSRKTGKHFQLPSEAQWELAARGTQSFRYPWGNEAPDCTRTNHGCYNGPAPVGSHPAGNSPFNLYDMAGNVAEWCLDQYSADYYSRSSTEGPINYGTGVGEAGFYVIRGGSWDPSWDPSIRSSDRRSGYYMGNDHPGSIHNYTSNSVGFRIARVISTHKSQ